jgi:hypothetical protein
VFSKSGVKNKIKVIFILVKLKRDHYFLIKKVMLNSIIEQLKLVNGFRKNRGNSDRIFENENTLLF